MVFVHETLGIEPVSQTIRDLANRRPSTAVIQVSQIRTPALVIKAMEDGARVVAYPFAYEDVSTRVIAAAEVERAHEGRARRCRGHQHHPR